MNCENRKDEFSEHCEFLAKKQIAALPSTLTRQIARAKNMMHFGQERLNLLRQHNPFQIDVGNESMKALEVEIRSGVFLPEKPWQVLYVRFLLEYNWLGTLLTQEVYNPTEITQFAALRASLLKQIQQIEKEHNITVNGRTSQRWTSITPQFVETKQISEGVWVDDTKERLRSAVATELHWMNTLHKHGHSKYLTNFRTLLNFPSWTGNGGPCHPPTQSG